MSSNLKDFYYDILHIKKSTQNEIDVVKDVVSKEMELIQNYTENLEGFCKVAGTNIHHELSSRGIVSRVVNVQDYFGSYGKDHLFVVAFVKDENSQYLLIDPTYRQFCGLSGQLLSPLTDFPDRYLEVKHPNLLKQLLENGMTFIDDEDYQIYLSSLVASNVIDADIHLDDVLIEDYDRRRK